MKKLLLILIFYNCNSPKNEWVSLIKNNSLEGWHYFQDNGLKKGWSVEKDILIFDKISGLESGEDDASLLSDKIYQSFEISFEWKIEQGGNSGFMWGVNESSAYKFPYQTGPEIQIIDPNVYAKPKEVLGGEIELNNILSDIDKKKHYLGAVYDLFPPNEILKLNPLGDWNKYYIKIDQKNNRGLLKLNEVVINEFPLRGTEWDEMLINSKFNKSEDYPYLGVKRWYDFAKFKKGSICLQDHPGKAYFKNIKIRELY
tara:strand:+ start:52 stop:822 length:771 start_codon:yes stop_codon:yes gene_type:complete